jgi:hypothetical protein
MTILEAYSKACDSGEKTAGNQTQYKITVENDTVYLALQGSIQKQDWLYNFQFAAVPYRNMEDKWLVHRGFNTAWKLARDQISAEVTAAYNANKARKIVILGYSHGAALTVLAHEYFLFNGYHVESFGFGCPRVLWLPGKAVRGRFENLFLYQNRGDIVTLVPPAIFGYVHVGHVRQTGPARFPSHIPHLDYADTLKGI